MFRQLKEIAFRKSEKTLSTQPEAPRPEGQASETPAKAAAPGIYAPRYPVQFREALKAAEENYIPLSNPLSHLSILCDALLDSGYVFSSMRHFLEAPATQYTVTLRHDIDAHPPTAVEMARIYAAFSLPASFYFLHSAPYYLEVNAGHIFRNPLLEDWTAQIALCGCEVGLHNDALGLGAHLNTSSAEILAEELGYLRGLGLTVTGSVAHNSFPVHGAENFEVFQELQMFSPDFFEQDQIERLAKLRSAHQIASASMVALGLSYEGNFPRTPAARTPRDLEVLVFSNEISLQNADWMYTYFHRHPSMERGYDADIWVIGKNAWTISDRSADLFIHKCGIRRVREYLLSPKRGRRLVITLHPEYFLQPED